MELPEPLLTVHENNTLYIPYAMRGKYSSLFSQQCYNPFVTSLYGKNSKYVIPLHDTISCNPC